MKKKKITALAAVGCVTAVLMLSGTFAWTSISQKAVNKKVTMVNPGARLHDDWDGTNKRIYVENFTDPDDTSSSPVFVRVRLREYMETGKDAGKKDPDERNEVTPLLSTYDINQPEEWMVHVPNALTDPFHKYWSWSLGGSTYYMPTFNKNKDSVASDINGTYENLSGANGGVPFGDYESYGGGETASETAVYDADDNDVEDANVTYVQETHTAQATLTTAAVLTMDEWLNPSPSSGRQPKEIGNYWVWDEDGWAYWAAPLMPGTATGPLLQAVKKNNLTTRTYYGIYVEGQAATAGDWGTPAADGQDATGFHIDGLTENAEILLNTIITIQ